jgi:hypothetical protein
LKNDAFALANVLTSGPNPRVAKFQLASLMIPYEVSVHRAKGPAVVKAAGLVIPDNTAL